MRVKVKVFARLRDLVGAAEAECDVREGAKVSDVWRALESRHAGIAAYASSVSAAVNADFAKMTSEVHDGDEVAFLPPVSGG